VSLLVSQKPGEPRYAAFAQTLHWVTVVLIAAILPIAWTMVQMPRDAPWRETIIVTHKSIGVTVLLVVIARLIWRVGHKPPPLRPATPRWMEVAGDSCHWLLYLTLLVMPISGYLASSSGRAVSYFGLFDLPALPQNDVLRNAAGSVHLAAQWMLYALVSLHIGATAWHVAVLRDGLLNRMLPPQTPPGQPALDIVANEAEGNGRSSTG
jgi:cytochrome b561